MHNVKWPQKKCLIAFGGEHCWLERHWNLAC